MGVRILTPLWVCALLLVGSALVDGKPAQETVESGPGLYHLADNPEALMPAVTFLNEAPVIDGILDEGLRILPTGGFSEVIVDGRGPEMDSADRVSVTAARPTFRKMRNRNPKIRPNASRVITAVFPDPVGMTTSTGVLRVVKWPRTAQ